MNRTSSSPTENATTGSHSAAPEEHEEDAAPRELESALLTLAMFGGLVIFGIGCMVFGWN